MEIGSTATIAYTGTLEDGTLFGKATADEPMVFQTGMDLVMPGFENGILEMWEAGETKEFTVSCYDAYGEYRDDFVEKVPTAQVPMRNLRVGQVIWMGDQEGEPQPYTVAAVDEDYVTIDMNHPLAGKDLFFKVELLAVEPAPEGFLSVAEKARMQGQYDDAYTVSSQFDQ